MNQSDSTPTIIQLVEPLSALAEGYTAVWAGSKEDKERQAGWTDPTRLTSDVWHGIAFFNGLWYTHPVNKPYPKEGEPPIHLQAGPETMVSEDGFTWYSITGANGIALIKKYKRNSTWLKKLQLLPKKLLVKMVQRLKWRVEHLQWKLQQLEDKLNPQSYP